MILLRVNSPFLTAGITPFQTAADIALRLAQEGKRLAAERPAEAAELGELAAYIASLCEGEGNRSGKSH